MTLCEYGICGTSDTGVHSVPFHAADMAVDEKEVCVQRKNMIASIAAAALLTVGWGVCSAAAAETVGSVSAVGGVREGGASADEGDGAPGAPGTRNGTAYVGGGTWSYGVWSGEVHSVYVHDRSTHRASVKSSGVTTRSDWMPPTRVAYAHRKKALSGNQAFWATRG
ncbi:hypothetical protein DEJ24_06045 [Curtobacterium sp. MCPF17_001]|nr:hypothetical protein DEJ24_06045 [Curtobacterium sp. MCPF17_001]